MHSDLQHELIPRSVTLHFIDALNPVKYELHVAAQQWQLLDDTDHVPAAPSYTELLQHGADAQALSTGIVKITADFTRSPHSMNQAGHAVLAHLAMAALESSRPAPRFLGTAEAAPDVCASPHTRQYREGSTVIDHATARAFLRRASESLSGAVKELESHLEYHRFVSTLTPRKSPAPPPPRPHTHHR